MTDAELVTSDFNLAVYLTTQPSVRLVRTQLLADKRVSFLFTPADEGRRLATMFFADQAAVSPRLLLDRARALKSLIFQLKSGQVST